MLETVDLVNVSGGFGRLVRSPMTGAYAGKAFVMVLPALQAPFTALYRGKRWVMR